MPQTLSVPATNIVESITEEMEMEWSAKFHPVSATHILQFRKKEKKSEKGSERLYVKYFLVHNLVN